MSSKRKSNASVEQVMLLEHWKNPIAVLMKEQQVVINGVMEVFLTSDSLNQRLEKEDKAPYSYLTLPVIKAVDLVLHNECEGLAINGLAPQELYLAKEDLMSISNETEIIVMLTSVVKKEMKREAAFQKLMDKEFWILGKIPDASAKKGDEFGLETLKRDHGTYEAVKLFVTQMNAQKVNFAAHEINRYQFAHLVSFLQSGYGIIIEPHEDYWIEFKPEELADYQKC